MKESGQKYFDHSSSRQQVLQEKENNIFQQSMLGFAGTFIFGYLTAVELVQGFHLSDKVGSIPALGIMGIGLIGWPISYFKRTKEIRHELKQLRKQT